MSVPMDGTVAVRHVAKRSAQNPAVHFASDIPTGWNLACGEAGVGSPMAGLMAPRSGRTARTDRRISIRPGPRLRSGDGDVQFIGPRLHLEREPGRLVPGELSVHGGLFTLRQFAVAERDRHDGDAVIPRQRPVARVFGPPTESAVWRDVP